ncbi:MAG TPA: hypothetical protein VEK14_02625, partial [Rhodomicrobium sp.]|nr:hypothetical protein [Rhodomicrobium sp.]
LNCTGKQPRMSADPLNVGIQSNDEVGNSCFVTVTLLKENPLSVLNAFWQYTLGNVFTENWNYPLIVLESAIEFICT